MDYKAVYVRFISSRRLLEGKLEVFEVHHIRPRALGGGDEPTNLLKLRPGDHLFAHLLLAKIHGGPMCLPLLLMLNMERYSGRQSRALYEFAREGVRSYLSERYTGEVRGPMSPELRAKLSQIAKAKGQRVHRTPDGIRRIGEASAARLQDGQYKDALFKGHRARLEDPVKMEAFRETMRKASASPEARARLLKAVHTRWAKVK